MLRNFCISKQVAVVIIITFFTVACNSYRAVENVEYKKFYNVNYGNDRKHKMDVFVPNQIRDSAFIVIIHGGGWRFGSKIHLRHLQKYLLKNGVASTSLNYRLVQKKINYQHQLDDVDRALKFIQDSLEQERNLILLGESSGGHLALLYAYSHVEDIEKVITFAAPTDFYSDRLKENKFYYWLSKPAFSRAVGERYEWGEAIPQSFIEASPIYQVTNVPTYIFQGTCDMLVNKNQAIALEKVLQKKNVPHEVIWIKYANHTPRLMPWWRKKIYAKVLEIIQM